jgi:hypothetical protein
MATIMTRVVIICPLFGCKVFTIPQSTPFKLSCQLFVLRGEY